jgi:hypothetical protein
VLYNDDTKEELYFSDYGEVDTPGLTSVSFFDMKPGKYVFLMLDDAWDGICCKYGNGYVNVYEVYPLETGRGEELRWSNDGTFLNAVGSFFTVTEDDDRRVLSQNEVDTNAIVDSPYLT